LHHAKIKKQKMMDNLFYFKSKSSKKSEKNLLDFIYRCKNNLTVFGEDLKWDIPV